MTRSSLGRMEICTLTECLREANRLKDENVIVPKAPRPKEKKALVVSVYFPAALAKNRKALATFEAFP